MTSFAKPVLAAPLCTDFGLAPGRGPKVETT